MRNRECVSERERDRERGRGRRRETFDTIVKETDTIKQNSERERRSNNRKVNPEEDRLGCKREKKNVGREGGVKEREREQPYWDLERNCW